MLTPLNKRVLIKPDEKSKVTSFGFALPDPKIDDKPISGVVVVGNTEVRKGERVIFSKFGFDEVKEGNETLFIVSSFNILAKFA